MKKSIKVINYQPEIIKKNLEENLNQKFEEPLENSLKEATETLENTLANFRLYTIIEIIVFVANVVGFIIFTSKGVPMGGAIISLGCLLCLVILRGLKIGNDRKAASVTNRIDSIISPSVQFFVFVRDRETGACEVDTDNLGEVCVTVNNGETGETEKRTIKFKCVKSSVICEPTLDVGNEILLILADDLTKEN